MRLEPDMEALQWLIDFVPDIDHFDWDSGNSAKNLKHYVTREDIESIFFVDVFVFAGRIVEPVHHEWRGLILGIDRRGRHLCLIFTRRGQRLRPISCRPMRKQEVRVYHEKTKN